MEHSRASMQTVEILLCLEGRTTVLVRRTVVHFGSLLRSTIQIKVSTTCVKMCTVVLLLILAFSL